MDAKAFRRVVMALGEVEARPHFDRIAFRTPRKTFVTLAGDGSDANLLLELDHQRLLVAARPEAYQPCPGGWGRMGFTTMLLSAVSEAEARQALEIAYALAAPVMKPGRMRAAKTAPAAEPESTAKSATPKTKPATATTKNKAPAAASKTKPAAAAKTRQPR